MSTYVGTYLNSELYLNLQYIVMSKCMVKVTSIYFHVLIIID